jgi:hypothetical protein
MLRKLGFAVVAAMLVALPGQSNAADLPLKPPKPPLLPKMVVGGATGGAGLVSFVVVGVLGVVATMCAYDLYLKIEGVENWDGTPKAVKPHNFYHHTA